MRSNTSLFIINGVEIPAPDKGFEIIESTYVDSGRNVNNAIVGQIVGRNLWKINNLQWSNLNSEQWKKLKNALAPFFVPVTFTDDMNVRHTITMYPSDRTSTPYRVSNLNYTEFKNCKFNLIDCGWD